MRINHNIAALNTYRQLNSASTAQGKSMEKLSSGLRINKAGDDAAGLAISEKMRGQIRGLDMAAKNAQDGVSLLQTAEGALNETHDILQRMRELSVQSSNDTNTDADRESINTEINQLKEEIDRIGNTTEFNTKKLIDGSIGQKKLAGSEKAAVISSALGKETAAVADAGGAIGTGLTAGDITSLELKIDGANITVALDGDAYAAFDDGSSVKTQDMAAKMQEDINKAIAEYNKANDTNIANVSVTADSNSDGAISIKSGSVGATSTVEITANTTSAALALTADDATNVTATGSEGILSASGAGNVNAIASLTGDDAKMTFTVDGKEIAIDFTYDGSDNLGNGTDATQTAVGSLSAGTDSISDVATALQTDLNNAIANYNKSVPTSEQVADVKVSVKDGALVVESGSDKATSSIKFDNSEAAQLLGLAKQNSATQGGGVDFQIGANQTQTMKVTIEDMRTDALGIKDIDLSNKAGAQEAITKINDAIEKVSTQRSNLGAFQNRLEHTINNLGTSSENLTAAESRVRDVDMAKEMMEQTKNSILSQAAQAMLAQANQQPQGVLQLLR
ncbi:flagellin [Cytobacillus firmus]|uniref:flagellin N-terminal helical domain-containing protein n=1 Tax=Cytobacillus firmus TaxID=1399 RepID=UPI0024C20C3A|nr:flagellin [Cytobacillus firmus]WHY33788.1 flagellin [Cytobacillus firmus]